MTERKFQPGFRLSALDILVLIIGGLASAYIVTFDQHLATAIAFVVLHFFLICNVLRMSRPLELIWAGMFIALAAAAISLAVPPWPIALALSSIITILLTVIETRRPSYHGVLWQKLNPHLLAWWQ